ncbi:flavoprotein [Erysipelothrix anatis]|uniref:flavoprotein n=1 Tax=Erysipelothrix anatis TaxID=2683713 RepID=UPI001356A97F|nr:flavoprotein [Erysipelothrix anatis]
MDKKTVILGVSGSIAAYKAADIVNRLNNSNVDVHVMMTQAAQAFITPLTLQTLSKNPVHFNVLEEKIATEIAHIDITKKADLLIIAPATANIIGKLANGVADDMLSTSVLALDTKVKKIIAPAMNQNMYGNPVVQKNLQQLKALGWLEIDPRTSLLACGDVGKGALADVDVIVQTVLENLQ